MSFVHSFSCLDCILYTNYRDWVCSKPSSHGGIPDVEKHYLPRLERHCLFRVAGCRSVMVVYNAHRMLTTEVRWGWGWEKRFYLMHVVKRIGQVESVSSRLEVISISPLEWNRLWLCGWLKRKAARTFSIIGADDFWSSGHRVFMQWCLGVDHGDSEKQRSSMFTRLHLMYLRRCVDQLLLVNDNSQLHFILSSNPIKSNEEKSFTLLKNERDREKQGEKTLATTVNIHSRLAGQRINEPSRLFEASILPSCVNPKPVLLSCFSCSVALTRRRRRRRPLPSTNDLEKDKSCQEPFIVFSAWNEACRLIWTDEKNTARQYCVFHSRQEA